MALSRRMRRIRRTRKRVNKSRARVRRGGGATVNLYFMMTATSMIPIYSDNASFDITKFMKNTLGTIGVTFPVTPLFGTNFSFSATGKSTIVVSGKQTPTTPMSWETPMVHSVQVGNSKIILQSSKGSLLAVAPKPPTPVASISGASISGAMSQVVDVANKSGLIQITPESPGVATTLTFPTKGVPLSGLMIGGLWTQGFGVQPDTGAIPPAAPPGTKPANVRIRFTLVP